MNIMLQTAGLFVMMTIFVFYFIDRKAEVRSNRQFLYFGIAIFVSLLLDITSLILIDYFYVVGSNSIQNIITEIVCKVYCFSCVNVTYFSFLYVILDIYYVEKKKYVIYGLASLALNLVAFVLILVSKIEVHQDKTGMNDFTSGLPVIFTYIFTFVNMAFTIAFTIIKRKQMNRKRVLGVAIFLIIWVLSAAIQGLSNYIFTEDDIVVLAVGFGEAMAAMVVYIILENPALNIDKLTGALNQRAFMEYVDYCFRNNKNQEFIIMDIDSSIIESIMGFDNFAKTFNNTLQKFKVKRIFKTDRNHFIAVRNKNRSYLSIETSINEFKKMFYSNNSISTEIPYRLIYISNIFLFKNRQDLVSGVKYITNHKKKTSTELVVVNEEIVSKLHEKTSIDGKCDIAFANKRFTVYYQPIFSIKDKTFTSAEALVRLVDEKNNLIAPFHFIEEMEKDGRIIELGTMVFEEVCKFIADHDIEELGLNYIEVNLSTVQCAQEDLADKYIEIMQKYKINPGFINLEITESGDAVKNTLLKNMEKLKAYGVSFSLDDFGTGNSNLNYIVEMPIEIVKFDKTMVNSYFDNKIATYVMRSTVNMIKELGHKIVFEGLEQANQIKAIQNLNVDYIQGYYYSRPLEKNQFKEFLIDKNK